MQTSVRCGVALSVQDAFPTALESDDVVGHDWLDAVPGSRVANGADSSDETITITHARAHKQYWNMSEKLTWRLLRQWKVRSHALRELVAA